jgi:phosphoenolpyruvate carboxykinase (ATP)
LTTWRDAGAEETGTATANAWPARLAEAAVRAGEVRLSSTGALVARTGRFTGRSPRDRYIVARPAIRDLVDWGPNNQPMESEHFEAMLARARRYAALRRLWRQDLWLGADPARRLAVRVHTEQAWHALFARNMFLRPPREALAQFEPDWEVLQLPGFAADPARDGTRSETVIAIDFGRRTVLVAGTAYAGEIKKSMFGVVNFLMPERDVFPMHCSANTDDAGNVALFFGLSGTGKTTLSADGDRRLVGDDEHGWSDDGVFNFEGGCYAKVIGLDPGAEPVIWAASNRFGAILENVVVDPVTAEPDFADGSLTENTRSSYPLDFVPGAVPEGRAGHPRDIVMLTCDAFGVLPPIARLDPARARYHFLSGYTARVAGTERGVDEPQATFSACFGAPFMPRDPLVYADMLASRMRRHGARCWLLNTGWTGGGYGVGRRMPLSATRTLLRAALSGALDDVPMRRDPFFGLAVPRVCAGVDPKLLDPEACWPDREAYRRTALQVAAMFHRNFARFRDRADPDLRAVEIRPGG